MRQPKLKKSPFWQQVSYLFAAYLLGILVFTLFRVAILLCNISAFLAIPLAQRYLIWESFFIGLRFDTLLCCALLFIPIVLFCIFYMVVGKIEKWVLFLFYLLINIFFAVAIMISTVDVPFFNFFFKRLNSSLFLWNNAGGFAVKMIFAEPKFYLFLLLYAFVQLLTFFSFRKFYRQQLQTISCSQLSRRYRYVFPILIIWGLLLLGIRGRIMAKSPIIAGTAYFSEFPFLNLLALNPVYTFCKSILDDAKVENHKLNLINEEQAIATMQQEFYRDSMCISANKPIARWQQTEPKYLGQNVVLVIMESMAAHRMARYGNTQNLTPFLDSLVLKSWSFDSTFSTGIHTFNGIYSTLFAQPALMKRHTMDQINVPQMDGLPNQLSKQGYQTIFFTTHDELFDNMSGFLSANNFHSIIGQKDYPATEVKSSMGVPDEYMFRFSIPLINNLAASQKPFFATYMTGSNHDPHVIPTNTGFVPHSENEELAVIEYSDWSLRKFMEYAAQQSWYQKTIFVFIADHGVPLWNDPYDVPFSYHHIPFFIFTPTGLMHGADKKLALQSDVFPTVMSMVSNSFVNSTFGINLFQERHQHIVFSSDDVLACISDSLLYIYRSNRPPSLYHYRNTDKTDYLPTQKATADDMARTAFSWLQVSQKMITEQTENK